MSNYRFGGNTPAKYYYYVRKDNRIVSSFKTWELAFEESVKIGNASVTESCRRMKIGTRFVEVVNGVCV